jgi:beta-mannosidase
MKRSLDQIERDVYCAKPGPLELAGKEIDLFPPVHVVPTAPEILSLDGEWDMVKGGNVDRVYEPWEDIIPAKVPGSVHAALIEASVIPEPTVGKQDAVAREMSYETWWLRRRFTLPENFTGSMRLSFGGVCDRCMIWLNGRLLGGHQGMFGGPEYDVTEIVEKENVLMVMLYPAPYRVGRKPGELNPFFDQMNIGWIDTTVFNCVYGWHYANIPALGIWRSVTLECVPEVELVNPFAAAKDINGCVSVHTALSGPEGGYQGVLRTVVKPANFKGNALEAEYHVNSKHMRSEVRFDIRIPDPQLWWPNGLGKQCLYTIAMWFEKADGTMTDLKSLRIGLRTIEMAPDSNGVDEERYNWQFVLNGKPIFVKGTNWCTIDYAMRFTKERYDRFLSLARDQHIQLVRAWGGGMPETADFYDLCDDYGIMVLQEFPTAWDSQKVQPADILREGVIRTVLRLRHHAALAMWGGGNESERPTDAVIDMMGRICYELDGTRVFHRNDPWGGSSHNYSVYWGMQDFDWNLSYTAPFIGEFGFASSPNIESVRRYIPKKELDVWPAAEGSSHYYHTPVYNQKNDVAIIDHYIPKFLPNTSFENMVIGTQMSQVTALRHTLELARTRRPEATGICYYKLTDVWPAISWSTIDYYGVPKIAYFFIRHSYAPLTCCALLSKLNPMGEAQSLPVWILDDADELVGKKWMVRCQVFDSSLKPIKTFESEGEGSIDYTRKLGTLELTAEETMHTPLLITVDLFVDGERREGTFYWLNYEAKQGCLFDLPRTTLAIELENDDIAVVSNTGDVPAVGVQFNCEAFSDTFICEDNFFWLAPGETRRCRITPVPGLTVSSFNSLA